MPLTPTLLLILDGWGIAPPGPGNAISQSKTPNLNRALAEFPRAQLLCSGQAVGLPDGQMGNSEVGHLNIGAGRIVYQDFMRINLAIEQGLLAQNPTLIDLFQKVLHRDKTLHFIGLVSPGGVHSHQDHLSALLQMAKGQGLSKVKVHVILDGRDTPPQSGLEFVRALDAEMHRKSLGDIATITGRYYAMDRDQRWDRTLLAYQVLTQGKGIPVMDPLAAIAEAYATGETDEFLKPRILQKADGSSFSKIGDGDGIFFFNFRADRARQLTKAFCDSDFQDFKRESWPQLGGFATMTEYDASFELPAAFPPQPLTHILGEVLADHGLKQLRLAETEKYAHVTYFFNGGEELTFPGEERILIPSPRDVATYDLRPEMSVHQVSLELCRQWEEHKFDLIVCNLANMDMVGHTGSIPATIKACEAVDECLGLIMNSVLPSGGRILLTADHGNADEMLDNHGNAQTAHSCNPVWFVWLEQHLDGNQLRGQGKLSDIAPTILELWGIDPPKEMTGKSLVARRGNQHG